MICKYYRSGKCEYGNNCRYDHVKEKPTVQKPATNKLQFKSIRNGFNNNIQDNKKKSDVPSSSKANTSTTTTKACNSWAKPLKFSVDAPAFVPRKLQLAELQLCPYFEVSGECAKGEECQLVHGDCCEMCCQFVLHPYNEESRKNHHRDCLAEHEKAMKEAFMVQVSSDKQCGICMENIVDIGARFGILQNCRHCFCLKCIREWRKKEEFEKKVVRSCPECRVRSDFIIPSSVWVEDQEEKDEIISTYQQNMKQKVCKYMASGVAEDCPFGNKCFYKHQLPDGSIVPGKSPQELRSRLNRRYNLADAFEIISSMELIQSRLFEDLWTDDESD
ncbi:unnamed protein product [Bursaphelenchus okinawaensis]|uniref:RING-type E3 ubiquitin transferase n=1 Tax=Bursaphelenchus okinawaensis TaxID=465554 RepID=A0A811KTC1_9BILA|nr:unnamed protein product [Bursaphelenchus okinawaensis]CAG9112935.1 unnamed protein product [Bursaphelenchus okinawaensis]